MPYTPEHRARTKQTIVEAAREQFNLKGFDGVSIDQIMQASGLSRGGFYHHFKNKEDLFAAAVESYSTSLTETLSNEDSALQGHDLIDAFLRGYLDETQLVPDGTNCPMIALPSDVARSGPVVKRSYQQVLEAMLAFFQENTGRANTAEDRTKALALCSITVGGMVLARSIDDDNLKQELITASLDAARNVMGSDS